MRINNNNQSSLICRIINELQSRVESAERDSRLSHFHHTTNESAISTLDCDINHLRSDVELLSALRPTRKALSIQTDRTESALTHIASEFESVNQFRADVSNLKGWKESRSQIVSEFCIIVWRISQETMDTCLAKQSWWFQCNRFPQTLWWLFKRSDSHPRHERKHFWRFHSREVGEQGWLEIWWQSSACHFHTGESERLSSPDICIESQKEGRDNLFLFQLRSNVWYSWK
jgi:hypothetical protein